MYTYIAYVHIYRTASKAAYSYTRLQLSVAPIRLGGGRQIRLGTSKKILLSDHIILIAVLVGVDQAVMWNVQVT